MNIFQLTLSLSIIFCSLVAGFLFAFTIVVMPGIKQLTDGEYIRAFQVMDGIIQKNQPVFMLVWIGSIIIILAAAVLGIGQLDSLSRLLLISAALIYLVGVQVPTGMMNIPLNNQLQALDANNLADSELHKARENFEAPWNKSNTIRTFFAVLTSVLLVIVLLRI
ncbi:DUF1772 domain-containing protein [uncultured Desulfuromusa sp.]|uniref:anthrone oxygenase family protein n=1 Tax=uncultured Desulfuromusa sp. TaxID=219183 RepID=UPI002AA5F9E5|nr:DUF1772 domain-containing protein [uncultured Desulfuromusa sp.]